MALSSYSLDDLKDAVLRERIASYMRLRGGFPIPLAGAIYWLILGFAGYRLELVDWAMLAFIGSGAIFPLALLLAKIFKNNFMKDKNVVHSVLIPTFISMLLFWAFIVIAVKQAPEMVPAILAIGMSVHWPVIGWSYGRAALFSAHSIIRAIVVVFIWFQFPEHHLTWLSFSVALVYLLTVIAILVDTGRLKKNIQTASKLSDVLPDERL